MTTVIEGCAIATVDGAGTEHRDGHLVIEGDRIVAVGGGPAPDQDADVDRIDGRGCLATPGLVNSHHHLYQWATRGLAQQATPFEWLVELYPVWAHVDAEVECAAARAGLAALARSGCSTSTDHHYVFPAGAGDLLEVEIEAARALGVRFHPCRGSMDLGRSDGGLPPDEVVEDRDAILAASEAAIDRFHHPAPGAMVRVALAPCSPFSVTQELMAETAQLARRLGVRLHTHLAETLEEEAGARCLGRDDELGSLEVGKVADVALWRLDGLDHAGIEDPVAALVLGAPRPVDLLLVGGRAVVQGAELRTADEAELAADIARESHRLLQRVEAPRSGAGLGRPEAARRHQIAGLDAPRR